MSGCSQKRKLAVVSSDHAYPVATGGGLGSVCVSPTPDNSVELADNKKRACSRPPTTKTKTAAGSHCPRQRRMLDQDSLVVEDGEIALEDMEVVEMPRPGSSTQISDQTTPPDAQPSSPSASAPTPAHPPGTPQRRRLNFPSVHGKSASELFNWFAALLKQHPSLQPLYKEGRNQPYITVSTESSFYPSLVTDGFMGLVMECPSEEGSHTVIIHGVSTHINVNLLEVPVGFLWLKRRVIGQGPRPQLLGVVTGEVPHEVHLLGLGRRRVER